MRFILSFVTLLLLFVCVFTDTSAAAPKNKNIIDNKTFDNVSKDNKTLDNVTRDNKTKKNISLKLKIKPKLVPDRFINDKNSFMTDFGFPEREEFKINTDLNAKNRHLYDNVTLTMKNRWSKTNIWGKDFLYIEGIVSGGAYGFNYFSIKPANAQQKEYVIPYGSISLKFMSGTRFSPELVIKDSRFIFTESKSTIDEQADNYNYYYLKLPLGFYIPFFGWKSEMYIDGSYSSLNNNFQVKDNLMVQGTLLGRGSSFHTAASSWNVRLYLDTPVVLKPSISEYAYFGIYYDETRSSRTALPGTDYAGGNTLLVDGTARSGGIFYEMRQDLYKGLMFGINVYAGIGDIETSSKYNVSYGNTEGLVSYKAKLSLGYQHIFKAQGVGIAFDVGAEYSGLVEFFYAKREGPYSVTLDGDIKYFAELKFLFGY